jgi:hypothetical protein
MNDHRAKAEEAARLAAEDQDRAEQERMEALGQRSADEIRMVMSDLIQGIEKVNDRMEEGPASAAPIFAVMLALEMKTAMDKLKFVAARAIRKENDGTV